MMSKVISIWSEENSLERIVMCLTNSGTEVMSKSSIVELSFTDLVGEIMMWWWGLYFTSGSQGLLWHFCIAPQFCL